jgi:dsRNA-specific ribonuclease
MSGSSDQNFSEQELTWLKNWGIEIPYRDFDIALTHGSLRNINPHAVTYQRFEFLGDAVISLITAEQHFRSPEELTEGVMTQLRSNEVRYKTLERIFDILELKDFIRTGHVEQSFNVRGDFVESIFGALFINQGYEACREFWLKILKRIDEFSMTSNQSAVLSEYKMSEKSNIGFGNPVLNVNVTLQNDDVKKQALTDTTLQLDDVKKQALTTFLQRFVDNRIPLKAPIIMLQELCQANHVPIPEYIEIERKETQGVPNFVFKVVSNPYNLLPDENITGIGQARSKQQAKMNAAANLCDQIHLPYALNTIS